MSKSAENMTENLAPCPFCGSRAVEILAAPCYHDAFFYAVCRDCKMHGPSFLNNPDRAVSAYNRRATTAPKHRPAEVLTGEDADRISKALFNADVSIDHLLPLHAVPCDPGQLVCGWEALLEELERGDEDGLVVVFGNAGKHISAALAEYKEYDDETMSLRESLRLLGGWVIMGSYPTISDITLNEQGQFSSCCVHWGIQRTFVVWGTTYKQAIAKAINAQRRYFDGEVAKAREAAGHGRA